IRTTRAGFASSSRSNNNSSTLEAVRENRLKLTPPSTTVAPRGELRPIVLATGITISTLHWFLSESHLCNLIYRFALDAQARNDKSRTSFLNVASRLRLACIRWRTIPFKLHNRLIHGHVSAQVADPILHTFGAEQVAHLRMGADNPHLDGAFRKVAG